MCHTETPSLWNSSSFLWLFCDLMSLASLLGLSWSVTFSEKTSLISSHVGQGTSYFTLVTLNQNYWPVSLELKGLQKLMSNFPGKFPKWEVATLSLSEKRGLGWEGSALRGLGETKDFSWRKGTSQKGPGLESFDGDLSAKLSRVPLQKKKKSLLGLCQ